MGWRGNLLYSNSTCAEDALDGYDHLNSLVNRAVDGGLISPLNNNYDAVGNIMRIGLPDDSIAADLAAAWPGETLVAVRGTTYAAYTAAPVFVDDIAFSNAITVEHNVLGLGEVAHILRTRTATGPAGGYAATDAWYAFNQVGSVMNHSNSSGAMTQAIDMDAWGNTLAENGSWVAMEPAGRFYQSKAHDPFANCNYHLNRWYQPQLGTWTASDLIGRQGGNNLYQFCLSDPIHLVDYDGLCPESEKCVAMILRVYQTHWAAINAKANADRIVAKESLATCTKNALIGFRNCLLWGGASTVTVGVGTRAAKLIVRSTATTLGAGISVLGCAAGLNSALSQCQDSYYLSNERINNWQDAERHRLFRGRIQEEANCETLCTETCPK